VAEAEAAAGGRGQLPFRRPRAQGRRHRRGSRPGRRERLVRGKSAAPPREKINDPGPRVSGLVVASPLPPPRIRTRSRKFFSNEPASRLHLSFPFPKGARVRRPPLRPPVLLLAAHPAILPPPRPSARGPPDNPLRRPGSAPGPSARRRCALAGCRRESEGGSWGVWRGGTASPAGRSKAQRRCTDPTSERGARPLDKRLRVSPGQVDPSRRDGGARELDRPIGASPLPLSVL
jgi:hypothetical protein